MDQTYTGKKYIPLVLLLLFGGALLSKVLDQGKDFIGKWLGDSGKKEMEIYQGEDGLFYGRILRSEEAGEKGKIMFSKLKFESTQKALTGILIHPGSGLEIEAFLTLKDPDKLKVEASKMGITRTFYFDRIQEKP